MSELAYRAPACTICALPHDVLTQLVAKLDLIDKFRFGGVNRRFRRAFKSPAVWRRVQIGGSGYVNGLLRRIYRVALAGLEHLVIRDADLTSCAFGVAVRAAANFPLPRLATITLGGAGYYTAVPHVRLPTEELMQTMRLARATFPALLRVNIECVFVVSKHTYSSGLLALLVELQATGLTLCTSKFRITCWPRTPAERAALVQFIDAQELVTRVFLEAQPATEEDNEVARALAARGLCNLRVTLFDRDDPLPLSQGFLDACFSSPHLEDTFVHGADLRGCTWPACATRARSLTVSRCVVDDALCGSLPRTLDSLALPQTVVTQSRALCEYVASAERLAYVCVCDLRCEHGRRRDLMRATLEGKAMMRVDATHLFLDAQDLAVVSLMTERRITVRVDRRFAPGQEHRGCNACLVLV